MSGFYCGLFCFSVLNHCGKADFTFESLSSFEIETGKDVFFLVANIQNMNNRKQRIIELFNMTVPNTPFDSTISPFGTVICPFWYCQILDKAKKIGCRTEGKSCNLNSIRLSHRPDRHQISWLQRQPFQNEGH